MIIFTLPIGEIIIAVLALILAGVVTLGGKVISHFEDRKYAKRYGVTIKEYQNNRLFYHINGKKQG